MVSSNQNPQSLVTRIRALADKRQKEAAREGRVVAQELLGAANGYRAIAEALERQQALANLFSKKNTLEAVAAEDESDPPADFA